MEIQDSMKQIGKTLVTILWAMLASGTATAEAPSARALARALIDSSAFPGGLVIHIGCGDGGLTAELDGGG